MREKAWYMCPDMGPDAVVRVNIPANYSGTLSVSYEGFWYWRVAK